MGQYCNGDFTIETETKEDTILICDMLNKLNESKEGHFNISHVEVDNLADTIVYGTWSSGRVPNGSWQMNEISNKLKALIREKTIRPVEFQASLNAQIESWYMGVEDWNNIGEIGI
jgi:hypothetical protein